MNKKGQSFGLVFSLLFFVIVWFVWLGSWLNTVGQYFISVGNLSGVEALIMTNFNIVVLFAVFLAFGGYAYLKQ